ncbi:MAG: head-tail adaptor protein [Patescibacteria group bacterium]|nr:head-tail adaptor protein [Patescibacteria group bacterium]
MLKGRNSGRLDILLTVQQIGNYTRNSINDSVDSWQLIGKIWAERVWNPSGERFEVSQQVASDNVTFNARYCAWITPMMRFVQNSEQFWFYITNVRSSLREDLTIITAERRDNQGDPPVFSLTDTTMDNTMQGS